jgi:hypothetical protein
LYASIAWAGGRLLKRARGPQRSALAASLAVNLTVNATWNWLFFGLRSPRAGLTGTILVAAVTNPVYAPGRDEHEQYREHVAASLLVSPWARVIKASDFTDYAGRWIMPSFAQNGLSLGCGGGKYRHNLGCWPILFFRSTGGGKGWTGVSASLARCGSGGRWRSSPRW